MTTQTTPDGPPSIYAGGLRLPKLQEGFFIKQQTLVTQGTPFEGSPAIFGYLECSAVSPSSTRKPENVFILVLTPQKQGKTHTDGDFSLLIMCFYGRFCINCRDCPTQISPGFGFVKGNAAVWPKPLLPTLAALPERFAPDRPVTVLSPDGGIGLRRLPDFLISLLPEIDRSSRVVWPSRFGGKSQRVLSIAVAMTLDRFVTALPWWNSMGPQTQGFPSSSSDPSILLCS